MEAAREFCQEVQTKRTATKEMEPDYLNSLLKGAEQIQCRMYNVHAIACITAGFVTQDLVGELMYMYM